MEILRTMLVAAERSFRSLDDDGFDSLGIVWESGSRCRVVFDLAANSLVYLEDVVATNEVRIGPEATDIDLSTY